MKSEPSYGEFPKKDSYTPYYPEPAEGRGMIGIFSLEILKLKLMTSNLRRNDGLRSAGRDGRSHARVVGSAFTISGLSCQVELDHSKHGQVLNIFSSLLIIIVYIDY